MSNKIRLKDLGRKPKILLVNEASFLRTGFSTYGWQILKRLQATGKYDIVELASYATTSDPRWKDPKFDITWKYYGVMPEKDDIKGQEQYKKDYHFNQFGKGKFDDICLIEKPDIVIDIRDRWMASEWQLKSQFRKYFTYIYMPCVDSHPPQPEWVQDYKNTDYILGYSHYAKHILEREGVKCWDVTNPGVDLEIFNTKTPRSESLSRWGFRKQVKPILGVFRNQKRKLLPDMVYSYLILKNKYPEAFKSTALWLHTSWPDVGFNIDLVMKSAMEGRIPQADIKGGIKEKKFKIPLRPSDVYFSYICHKCNHAFVNSYIPKGKDAQVTNLETGENKIIKLDCATIPCQKCGEHSARMPNTQKGFYPEDFAHVYRAAYVHVQPAIAGADEMPTNEAKACGTPVLAPTHAAMQEKVEKTNFCPDDRWKGGMPIDLSAVYTEAETMQHRCYFDKDHLAKQLNKVLTNPSLRKKLSKDAAETAEKYYNWDTIADKWDKLLWETIEVDIDKTNWNSPPDLREYGEFMIPSTQEKNDADFIKWCYSNFLNISEPDEPGMAYWMNDVKKGRTRENIVVFFKQKADEHNAKELARVGKKAKAASTGNINISDYLDKNDKFRILVVMPGTAGDLHLLTGSLKALYKKYRRDDNWGLYLSCDMKFADIVKGLPFIKNIIPYGNNLDNAKAVEKSGLFNICYTPHIISQRFEHYVHNGYGKHLIKAYGDMCDVVPESPEIVLDSVENLPDKYYVLHVKTSMASKDWPVDRFKSVARLFPDETFVQVGGPEDPVVDEQNVLDFRGKTSFNQMAYIIKKAEGIVGLDSIPLHIASTVGTTSLGLFSATYPNICGPLNSHGGAILMPSQRPSQCPSPCHMRDCPSKINPCIQHISVQEVINAMEKVF